MYWFLLFLGVAVVWVLVLALLARKLWGPTKALARELAAAQSKLDAAMQPPAGSARTGQHARTRA